jgi:preprotein translocase subunit SecF
MGPTQEDVFGMLRDGVMRRFRLDIENDSTITGNETQEKQDRTDFLEAVTKFLETWGPMVQAKPELAQLASALLLFAVRSFRVGRELEEVIEETADKMMQAAQIPPPPPEAAQQQAELQATQVKAQAEIQKANIGVQQSQVEGHLAIQAAEIKAHSDQQKASQDAQKLQNEAQRDAMKHQQTVEQMQLGMAQQAAQPPQGV